MTQTRAIIVLALALACVTAACGKYGPPQRVGVHAGAVEASGASAEAECEDEEKQP